MIHPKVDKVFRPYKRPGVEDRKVTRIRRGHLPCTLRMLRFLLKGCTSTVLYEVVIRFFNVLPIASLPTGISSSTFAFSSRRRSVLLELGRRPFQ